MWAARNNRTRLTPAAAAARMKSAVTHAVEPLESRVLFASGDLDVMFGGSGKVVLDMLTRNEFGNAVAVQADDKVVVAGMVATGTTTGNDVVLARLNPDGSLDTTFGTGGVVFTDLGSTVDSAVAVSVQADGRIVVGGNTKTTTTNVDFALVRYNANGTLDSTFGTGGKVRTDLGAKVKDQLNAMTLLPDGRIVVVGFTTVGGFDQQFATARYNVNGTLDTTFGGKGYVVTAYPSGRSQARAVAALADGSLIVAGLGIANGTSDNDFAAVHLLANGARDTTFGVGGWVSVNLLGINDAAESVVVMGDGHLMLVGQTDSGAQQDLALVRLTANGVLDTTFAGGLGYVIADIAGGVDWASAALRQSDGRIVVAGYGTVNDLNQFATLRFNPDGTLDHTFGGGDGIVTVSFPTGESFVEGLAFDSQQRLVVSGHVSAEAGFDIAVMRLENATNVAPTALAGGPYFVNAGGVVQLDGTGSTDSDGSVASYEWDFDYDGSSFNVDGVGARPDFSAVGVTGPVVRTVALRVTDNNGAVSVVATGLVTVNAAPTAHAGGAYLVNAGGSVQLDGSSSADLDGTVVSYEWDFDYDGSSFDADATGVSPSFSAAGLSGPGVRTIALRVTDDDGAVSAFATSTVTINALPVANAGGAYVVNAGGSIMLDGSASSDVDGSVVGYEWDLDYDGSNFSADATGATTTFSAAGLSGPMMRTVALRVTDNHGATRLVTTTVTVNALPTANAGGPYTVFAGQSVQFSAAGSGDLDGTVASYEWDFNYNGSTFHVDVAGATPMFSAANVGPGTRMVAVRVTDNRGATSIATALVTISQAPGSALLVADPANPGRQMLVVQGTSAGETLRLRSHSGSPVEVMLGNRSLGVFSGVSRVVVDGGDGNDVIDASELAVPVVLFGGAGDDKLIGGSGHDILVGGAGSDQLDGGDGNDVMVGGGGSDNLDSKYGDDLLVGASLAFETNLGSMTAVLAEWTRTDLSLSQRLGNLINGGGRNGSNVLSGGSMVEDNAADALAGTEGVDAWFIGAGDTVKKLKK